MAFICEFISSFRIIHLLCAKIVNVLDLFRATDEGICQERDARKNGTLFPVLDQGVRYQGNVGYGIVLIFGNHFPKLK